MREGRTSCTTSLPRIEAPRSRSHFTHEAYSPGVARLRSSGPFSRTRTHRPVRTRTASPGSPRKPAFFRPVLEVFDINRLVVVQIGDALPLRHRVRAAISRTKRTVPGSRERG